MPSIGVFFCLRVCANNLYSFDLFEITLSDYTQEKSIFTRVYNNDKLLIMIANTFN